jgi:Ca2+-binding RTX toxin-like protein
MADHQFESISATAAAAYAAAADTLSFSDPGATGSMVTVQYLVGEQVMLTLGARSVTFGPGLMTETGIGFPDGARLFVGGTGADTSAGTSQADGLYGGAGEDSLSGGAGGDLLQGNQGRDTLDGGADADTIYGGQGDDRILVQEGSNFAQGNLGDDSLTAAGAAGTNTLLGGQGADTIAGGGGAEFLNGNLGADSIAGGAGDDLLLGEGGADTLAGGAGADTFAAQAGSSDAALLGTFAGEVVDKLLDWSVADRIDKPGGPLPTPGVPGVDPSYYYELSPASTIADMDYYGPFGPPTPYDYWRARDECVRLMGDNPTLDVVAVQSDNDVLLFIDADGGNVPDLAIRLVGVSLDDIGFGNFI